MGKSKSSKDAILVREKEAMVLKFKIAGLGFEEIAKKLGYANAGGAYKAFSRAMARTIQEPATEYRDLNKDRLERLLMACWGTALKGDLKAIEQSRKLIADIRKLHGLDRPEQIELGGLVGGQPLEVRSVSIPIDEVERILDRFETKSGK